MGFAPEIRFAPDSPLEERDSNRRSPMTRGFFGTALIDFRPFSYARINQLARERDRAFESVFLHQRVQLEEAEDGLTLAGQVQFGFAGNGLWVRCWIDS